MQERLFSLLFEQDDITWQSLLMQLVREEGMDPWDIDVGVLSRRYLDTVHTLKGFDVRISAKVVLAAALLLRLKSVQLLEKDLVNLDQLLASTQEVSAGDFYEELEQEYGSSGAPGEVPGLVPRTPQPRKRKVSLDDLLDALRKALEVSKRRVLREIQAPLERPAKRKDISSIIRELYQRILSFLRREKRPLTFDELIPSDSRADKIATFVPLLHLSTYREGADMHGSVVLEQDEPFGQILITVPDRNA